MECIDVDQDESIGQLGDDVLEEEDSLQNSSTVSASSSVGRIRRFTNIIHQYFDDDDGYSKCKYCFIRLKGRNTTNLENHLKAKHVSEHKKFLEERTKVAASGPSSIRKRNVSPPNQSIQDAFRRVTERKEGLKKGSSEYEKCFRAIAVAFAGNSLAHHLVEDDFIKLMFTVVSDGRLRTLPSRKELSSKIAELTGEIKASIISSLNSANCVSITIDLWSRPHYSSSFMGVTCHYFDRDIKKLRRVLLACRSIMQPHTAENIFNLYMDILEDWNGLDDSKILRIVTDNGSNVVAAFKESMFELIEMKQNGHSNTQPTDHLPLSCTDPHLEDSFVEEFVPESESMEFDNSESEISVYFYRQKRLSCFAHNMMLVVKKAIDDSRLVTNAKGKAHSLIAAISRSPKAVQLLKEKTGGIGLVQPVITRWIYWYYVFDRLITIQNLNKVCNDLKILHELGPLDWDLLELVRDLLTPFAAAVTRLEGEHYATISEIYPMIFSLIGKLKRFQERLGQPTVAQPLQRQLAIRALNRIITRLFTEMDIRFAYIQIPTSVNYDPLFILATFLDPRYSLLIKGNLLDLAKRELSSMVARSSRETENMSNTQSALVTGDSRSHTVSSGHCQYDILDFALEEIGEMRRSSSNLGLSSNDGLSEELAVYVANTKTPECAQDDPFEFWVRNSEKLPVMFDVAVDVLSIPATSAPCERVFSRASTVLGKNRHRLSDKNLERELFLKHNSEFVVVR